MVLALALLLLAAEPPLPTGVPAPVAGKNPFLRQAKELYEKLDFEKCLQRLQQAPQWKSAPAELLEIELYAGMCHYNLNQRPDAEERFRLALRINPDAELPPYTSPKLVDFFLAVKRKLKPLKEPKEPPPIKEPQQVKEPPPPKEPPVKEPPPPKEPPPRDVDLPKDEPPAKKVEPPPVHKAEPPPPRDEPRVEAPPRLVPQPRPPAVPPIAEQPNWARRHPSPIALTVVAIVAVGAGIALGANAKSLERRANAATFESDFHDLASASQTNAVLANVSYGISGVAAAGAVLSWVFGGE